MDNTGGFCKLSGGVVNYNRKNYMFDKAGPGPSFLSIESSNSAVAGASLVPDGNGP